MKITGYIVLLVMIVITAIIIDELCRWLKKQLNSLFSFIKKFIKFN